MRAACGCEHARGSAGSARCVSLSPPLSLDSFAAPSTATISALLADTRRCNSAPAAVAGEIAVRILSADTDEFAAASGRCALDFQSPV